MTTLPDDESFEALARSLLSQGLVACATALPGARSMYSWQGRVEDSRETVVLIKTRTALVPRLTEAIRREHPYELPEVVAVPVTSGLGGYLDWIREATRDAPA